LIGVLQNKPKQFRDEKNFTFTIIISSDDSMGGLFTTSKMGPQAKASVTQHIG
jgi:hypothetical protein